ncbi:hypothetical protein [Leptothoe spongobia]|uniref:Uncharacterized protein n=1 Tax=Leptothoe spongobia TAU-MAC 1115 TaxID=1967444 RepID=A0A947GJ59_9CYAN|nr:hypothetical protein [Leptothoe spongobia]MBT9316284.1 hypothetical protein [Leptothoe spongobia TAU-MAC 1115]
MVLGFIKPLAKAFVDEIDSRSLVERGVDALANRLLDNDTVAKYLGKLNQVTSVIAARFDGLGYKGVLLKNLVAAQLSDMTDDIPGLEAALAHGDKFLGLIFKQLTPEILIDAIKPVLRRVAIAAVQELNDLVDGNEGSTAVDQGSSV